MPTRRPAPQELTVVCEYCDGAGVIIDRDDSTIGVVCAGCGGRAYRQLVVVPFSGRRKIPGIRRVRWAGGHLTPFSTKQRKPATVTYAEFLKGKLP